MDVGGVRHVVVPETIRDKKLLGDLLLLIFMHKAEDHGFRPEFVEAAVDSTLVDKAILEGEYPQIRGTHIIQYVNGEPSGYIWLHPLKDDHSVVSDIFVKKELRSRDSAGRPQFQSPPSHEKLGEALFLAAHEHSNGNGRPYLDGNALSREGKQHYEAMRKRHPHIFKPR